MKHHFKFHALLAALCLLFPFSMTAQRTDANVIGHVLCNGNHLPGITIQLKGTERGTATDQTGHYNLNNLPVGVYILRAQGIGFTAQEKQIELKAGTTIEIHFELQADQIELDQVVVSASRNETSRREAPVIVNVITPKTFQNTQSTCLAGGLNYQTGLRVESNCQNCGFPQVRINGLEGPYSQLLIDSRPLFSALNGVYGLEHIPVSMIERVEVVRGGGSALFGSNAVAGTINIITREPRDNSFSFDYSTQMYNAGSIGHNFNLNNSTVSSDGKSGMMTYGMYRQQDPWDANGDGFSEIGRNRAGTLGFRSFYTASEYDKLILEMHYILEDRRGGNAFSLQPHESDITEMARHNITGGGLQWKHFAKDNQSYFNVYASAQYTDRNSYYGAGKDPNAYGHTTDLSLVGGVQWSSNLNLGLPSYFTSGAEYQVNQLEDAMPGYNRLINQKINVAGFFLQNEWRYESWSFTAGARADKHNLLEAVIFSPRAILKYDAGKWMQARLNFGTGFRAPQAYDEDLHVAAVGGQAQIIRLADNLGPEKSYTFSASTDFWFANEHLSGNLLIEGFRTHLTDVFILEQAGHDEQGNMKLERRNGPGATVAGLNLESKLLPFRWLQIQAGFTFQKSNYEQAVRWSEDPDTEPAKKMLRSPETYGYMTAQLNATKRWAISLSGIYTGSMDVPHYAGYIAKDELVHTNQFFDMGIKLAYTCPIDKEINIDFYSGIRNIFNDFQSDFDTGEYRDSKYIYGPREPSTFYFGIKLNYE